MSHPISLILSLAMLLRHLGEACASDVIETAIAKNLPNTRTRDLGGTATTQGFTTELIRLPI